MNKLYIHMMCCISPRQTSRGEQEWNTGTGNQTFLSLGGGAVEVYRSDSDGSLERDGLSNGKD